jgi:hypothetical protein
MPETPLAAISLAAPYAQNFDTLASSGTANPWADDSTIAGWYSTRTTYIASNGASNTGALYSFGATGNAERALGSVASGGTDTVRFGARFTNDTATTIVSVSVAYTGEQWRNGGNTTQHALSFDYQVGASVTSLTSGTWTPVTALDFTGPIATSTAGALDGNASANRVAISHTFAVSIAPGHEIMLRWSDPNDAGNDHGLAIDDLTVTASAATVDDPPAVVSTNPANGDPNVAVDTAITVQFSESVDVTADAFTVECPVGTPVTFSSNPTLPATGASSVVLTPDSDLPNDTACTVTVVADEVTDTDGTPQNMAADYVFIFTTIVADVCSLAFTPVYDIQGSGAATPIPGAVTTQGVVVGDYEGPLPALRGFYLQDLAGDGNPATSDGIFVFNGSNNSVSLGDVVRLTGTAEEFQNQTQITSVTSIISCGSGSVTPVDITLPFASAGYLERYEGMLVRLPQTLYVTEHFQLGRFGQVVLTSRPDRLQQPTNVVLPGAPALALQAANNLDRIILDDGLNNQNPDPILFGRGGNPLSAANTLRGGDSATGIVGVMTYTWAGNAASGNAYRVRPIGALNGGVIDFQPTNQRPATPSVSGRLRVTAANVLNYFNTFGSGNCTLGVGGGPTDCRGAENLTEFDRQWPKIVAMLVESDAAVIGVMEIENDGYGPTSAIAQLVDQMNGATSAGTYAFIDADVATSQVNALGADAIKVGLIYKPASVTPIGTTAALNTTSFVTGGDSADRNRPALAQAFEETGTNGRFIVVVNHLKSKGSACDAPDAGDGQGNCNIVRLNAATEMAAWLTTDPTGTGDPDILIMGDLNSYAMEDPISAIESAGYTNLIYDLIGQDAYSYAFDGQWGYLDHALASLVLASQVASVEEWHINADEPSVLDYNTNFKSSGQQVSLYAPDEFRSADHDPVLVGLNLIPAEPSIVITKTVGLVDGVCATESEIDVAAGTTVYYCYTVTNTGDVTLNLHDLSDDVLGTLFSGLNYALAPGDSVNTVAAGLSIPYVANDSVTNSATWTAYNQGGPSVSATATATVTVADIQLIKTVGTTPGVCALTTSIDVPAGTQVFYCYTVINTGDVTLNLHNLVDSKLGPLFLGFPFALAPGASINTVAAGLTFSAVIDVPTTNVATWTAYNQGGPLVSATATATVNIPYLDVAIELIKTVGTEPGVCAATTNINVSPGTTVYYCYTIINEGDVMLDLHDLEDDQLGQLLTDYPMALLPGESVSTVDEGLVFSAVIDELTTNVATWTAYDPQGRSATATATATVTVAPPTAVTLAGLSATPAAAAGSLSLLALPAVVSLALGAAYALRRRTD